MGVAACYSALSLKGTLYSGCTWGTYRGELRWVTLRAEAVRRGRHRMDHNTGRDRSNKGRSRQSRPQLHLTPQRAPSHNRAANHNQAASPDASRPASPIQGHHATPDRRATKLS